MNREEQIKEMKKIIGNVKPFYVETIVEALYNAGYRKTFTSDIASDTQKAFKEGYEKAQSELKAEIERLKDDYAKLQELFAQYQIASDKEIMAQKKEAEKRFENKMKSVLEIEKKQAKIDVLNELKNRLVVYYPSVISEIDELLKEYEE